MIRTRPRKRGQSSAEREGEFEIVASVIVSSSQIDLIIESILES